ncbi:MAG: hypothetical protein R3E68_16540 [Burkholderiaceae bacterium]
MSRGAYRFRPELPFVIGMEGAGRCAADEAPFRPGDKVCFHGKEGACATHVVVREGTINWPRCRPVTVATRPPTPGQRPDRLRGAGPRGQLQAGETLLVHGATGGMGVAAVQLGGIWARR